MSYSKFLYHKHLTQTLHEKTARFNSFAVKALYTKDLLTLASIEKKLQLSTKYIKIKLLTYLSQKHHLSSNCQYSRTRVYSTEFKFTGSQIANSVRKIQQSSKFGLYLPRCYNVLHQKKSFFCASALKATFEPPANLDFILKSEKDLDNLWINIEPTDVPSTFTIISKQGFISLINFIKEYGFQQIWCSRTATLLNHYRNVNGYYIESEPVGDYVDLDKQFLSTALQIFVKLRSLKEAENVFNELVNGRYNRNYSGLEKELVLMVRAYANHGDTQSAESFLDICRASNVENVAKGLVALVKAYSDSREYTSAEVHLKELVKYYQQLNNTFGIRHILKKIASKNSGSAQFELAKADVRRAYLFYICALSSNTDLPIKVVESAFERFREIYTDVVPINFYNTIINACLLRHNKEKSGDWMREMSLQGMHPDTTNFNIWINYFASNGSWSDLKDLINVFNEFKLKKNQVTMLNLMVAEYKKNNLAMVKKYFWDYIESVLSDPSPAKTASISPHIISFILQFGIEDLAKWSDEIAFIIHNINKGNIKKDIVIDSLLMRIPTSYSTLKSESVTLDLFYDLEARLSKLLPPTEQSGYNSETQSKTQPDHHPNQTVYNRFTCLPENQKIQFWQDFKQQKLEIVAQDLQSQREHVLATLLIFLVSTGNYDMSLLLYSCAVQDLTYKNIGFFNVQYSLLYAQLKKSEHALAIATLKRISESSVFKYGYPLSNVLLGSLEPGDFSYRVPYLSTNALMYNYLRPNIKVYTILFRHAAENKNFDQIEKLWDLMKANGLVLDIQFYLQIVKAHLFKGRFRRVIALYHEAMKAKLTPEPVLLTFVMKAACRMRRLKEATQLLHDAVFKHHIVLPTLACNYLIKTMFVISPNMHTMKQITQLFICMVNNNNTQYRDAKLALASSKVIRKIKEYEFHDAALDLESPNKSRRDLKPEYIAKYLNTAHLRSTSEADSTDQQPTSTGLDKTKSSDTATTSSANSRLLINTKIYKDRQIKDKSLLAKIMKRKRRTKFEIINSSYDMFQEIIEEFYKNREILNRAKLQPGENGEIANHQDNQHHAEPKSDFDESSEPEEQSGDDSEKFITQPMPPNLNTFTMMTKYAMELREYNLVASVYELFKDYEPVVEWERTSNPRLLGNSLVSHLELNRIAEAKEIWERMVSDGFIPPENGTDFELNHVEYLRKYF